MVIRAVVGARVSDYNDPRQVSPELQREAGERYAKHHDWEIVGYFEDLDVSASIAPWDRPDLGPWLDDRAAEWDAMIFAKVDRAFRSVKDCADVAHWAEQHRKVLVFTDDGIVLNFRDEDAGFASMMAKAFLMLASLFAEMELKRIRTRIKDAQTLIRTTTRWSGGHPPYGYRAIDHPEGGRTLAIDPESAEVVRLMARMLLESKSLWEVADALNADGVPTPTNYRVLKGAKSRRKTVLKGTWTQAQVGQILRNQSCMGLKMMGRGAHKRVIRGDNGLPIQIADPLFTGEEWGALQAAIDKRTATRERSGRAAPLLGIVYCGTCRQRLYRTTRNAGGKTYTYYRCVKTADKPRCPGHSFSAEELTSGLDKIMFEELDDIPVIRKIFVPGEDHTRELDQVRKAMVGIREERDMGAYEYPGGDDEYRERLTALVAQRRILEALPQREDEWREEPTGETVAGLYARSLVEDRRRLLLSVGVRVYCKPGEPRVLYVPHRVRELAQSFSAAV